MRYVLCALTIVTCLAATGGIAYLLGHSRALGHEDWQFETRLMRAYAGEVPLHAGPLGILAVAALFSMRSLRSLAVVLVCAAIGAGMAIYETHETVRTYILTTPGQFMVTPAECVEIQSVLWLGAVCVLARVLIHNMRLRSAAGNRG